MATCTFTLKKEIQLNNSSTPASTRKPKYINYECKWFLQITSIDHTFSTCYFLVVYPLSHVLFCPLYFVFSISMRVSMPDIFFLLASLSWDLWSLLKILIWTVRIEILSTYDIMIIIQFFHNKGKLSTWKSVYNHTCFWMIFA